MDAYVKHVNRIRQMADDLYTWAQCTWFEYNRLNPSQTPEDYAEALIDATPELEIEDEADRRLLLRRIVELVERDIEYAKQRKEEDEDA